MNFKKVDSLVRLIERACHKKTLPWGHATKKVYQGGCPIPTNVAVISKLLDGDALLH